MKKLKSVVKELDNGTSKNKVANEQIEKLRRGYDEMQKENAELRRKVGEEKQRATINSTIGQGKLSILKSLFVGNLLMVTILIFFQTRTKGAIFQECGEWFNARANDLYHSLQWLKDGFFMGLYSAIKGKLHVGEVGGGLLTVLVILLIVGGIVALFSVNRWKLKEIARNFRMSYTVQDDSYKLLKLVVSVDIAIGFFIACTNFYEPFKKLMHGMNIFSIWLTFTAVALLLWNGNDIIRGFRK